MLPKDMLPKETFSEDESSQKSTQESRARVKGVAIQVESALNAEERKVLILEHRVSARRMAKSILRKWRASLHLDDLYSVVDTALCEAALRFDPERGVQFVSFLFYHLHGLLVKTITRERDAYMRQQLQEDLHAVDLMTRADEAGINDAAGQLEPHLSSGFSAPDEELLRREMWELGMRACKTLEPLEQEVVYHTILCERTVSEVAMELGYSRSHLSRVKRSAISNLAKQFDKYTSDDMQAPTETPLLSACTDAGKVTRRKAEAKALQGRFGAVRAC